MIRLLAALVLALASSAAFAADITVGFLSLDDDPRHDAVLAYARIELKSADNTLAGAQLGIADSAVLAEATGNTVTLDAQSAGDAASLAAKVGEMNAAGQRFIIVDLPADILDQVAAATATLPVTLINTTAPDDFLRNRCYPNLLHTAASDRMNADSMVQFLRDHDWLKVLLLVGEEPRDRVIADSFLAAAQRYRLSIVAERPFTLAADPANREENNMLLLTGQADYDVVYIADSVGEFGRYLPYSTQLPRPVIGSTGLVATEWHWGLERYGAPQVTSRFATVADGRRMSGADWSAWLAAKAVATAYARARSDDPDQVDQFLRGSRLRIDGSKGVSMNFREWDGQLRQPMILATHNAVIAIPPLAGFLHQTNDLDTLGTDQPEHRCQ